MQFYSHNQSVESLQTILFFVSCDGAANGALPQLEMAKIFARLRWNTKNVGIWKKLKRKRSQQIQWLEQLKRQCRL